MNHSARGIVATIAVGLTSGVIGALAGWLSQPQERSGPSEIPRIVALEDSPPVSHRVAAVDDSGSPHRGDGDRESNGGAAAPDEPPPDGPLLQVQQPAKADGEVSGAPASDSLSPLPSLEQRAASFVAAQVSGWSSANAVDLAALARVYAEEVLYYGSRKSREAILLDKRRLLERWPQRTYQVQVGSISVRCLANVCKVGGMTDWQTRSVPRAASASGTAQFEYEVALSGDAFSIISENSSVVKRDGQVNRR